MIAFCFWDCSIPGWMDFLDTRRYFMVTRYMYSHNDNDVIIRACQTGLDLIYSVGSMFCHNEDTVDWANRYLLPRSLYICPYATHTIGVRLFLPGVVPSRQARSSHREPHFDTSTKLTHAFHKNRSAFATCLPAIGTERADSGFNEHAVHG